MNSLRLAVGLLTAVPVGRLPGIDRRSAGRAMLWAPLTTVPALTALAAAHLVVAHLDAPAVPAAVVALAVVVLLSRGMHLDGLADTADGLSAGYDPEVAYRAMKAGDTGPSGVAAVVLALLLQASALAALLSTARGLALAAAALLVSRHALAWGCRDSVSAARPEGLGAMVAGSVGRLGLSMASLAVTAVAVGHGWWAGAPWWGPVVVLGVGLGSALVVLRRCRSRFGGVSGDVLGAMVEVAWATALAAAAVVAA